MIINYKKNHKAVVSTWFSHLCGVNSKDHRYFRNRLLTWHQLHNHRTLPWKEEKDVYRIWISEIILQQTRAEQGIVYYHRFLHRFPTLLHLAEASLEEVYKVWEGLGYYTRAKNLHATAQMIVHSYNGIFPDQYDQILSLKGIGPYTAAAISSFAFHLPYAVVDGNVFRVLSRFFGDNTPVDTPAGKKKFNDLATACLDRNAPHLYNQAIMDLGASICKPEQPLCTHCPLQKKCFAFDQDSPSEFPVKSKAKKMKQRFFVYFLLVNGKKIALEKRVKNDVWKNLYQFPMLEIKTKSDFIKADAAYSPLQPEKWTQLSLTASAKQLLSHQKIQAKLLAYRIPSSVKKPSDFLWITPAERSDYPMPRIMHLLLGGDVANFLQSL